MALRIMRVDKREETRASEIVKDWRKWATDNGYIKKGSLPVEQGRMSITLEIWERLSVTEDTYLFYHPEIPTRTDTEVEVSPLLWSSEILGYTIPEGEPSDAEKDLYAGI